MNPSFFRSWCGVILCLASLAGFGLAEEWTSAEVAPDSPAELLAGHDSRPPALAAQSGLSLWADRAVYQLCPACDVVPAPIRMTMVVANATCDPVTLTFPSSQEFDFEIRDAAGRIVWQWSSGHAFLPVIHTVTLQGCRAAGRLRQYLWCRAELAPTDVDSPYGFLEPGLYTLRGRLTADRAMEATITFEVVWGSSPRP